MEKPGTRMIQKDFKDVYNAIIPDDAAYEKYMKMRKSYLTEALNALDIETGNMSLKSRSRIYNFIS